jgi:hypothetical protein
MRSPAADGADEKARITSSRNVIFKEPWIFIDILLSGISAISVPNKDKFQVSVDFEPGSLVESPKSTIRRGLYGPVTPAKPRWPDVAGGYDGFQPYNRTKGYAGSGS